MSLTCATPRATKGNEIWKVDISSICDNNHNKGKYTSKFFGYFIIAFYLNLTIKMCVKGVKIIFLSKYTPLTCILISFVICFNQFIGGIYEN